MKKIVRSFLSYWCGIVLLLWGCGNTHFEQADSKQKALYGFEHPQDSTRTKVWWFHGETETTKEGITADLEAFRQAGVGGVVYYDQVHGSGEGACDAFSPEWWEMLLYASREAERLGLSFETHISNGFVAGGPWITPDLAMQMLTATDTVLSGGRQVEISLPSPGGSCYQEVAVLAFPLLSDRWETSRELTPEISCNVSGIDAKSLFTRGNRLSRIPAQGKGEPVYLNLDFGKDFTARSITYQVGPRGKATTSATNVPGPSADTFVGTGYRVLPDLGELEVSDDGINYRFVCALKPIYKAHSGWKQKTISFSAVTGRYFRLNLHDWQEKEKSHQDMQLGNVCLSSGACLDQWEEKAGLFSEYIEKENTPVYASYEVIDPQRILNLSEKLDSSGILRWNVPEGEWKVMRFVHVPIGRKIKHGRRNLEGLECDKMSARAAEIQWNNYFKVIADSIAQSGGCLSGMAMDSHEAGSQNWTPGFELEFSRLRGYELMKYLPVMRGYVVSSTEESARFLYDVRRTIADLIANKYYGTLQHLCEERGMEFTAQATGNALCIVADPIQAKGQVGKPQGEFWAIHPDGNYDIKESSSAAHLYGKRIASAEAFTDAQFSHSLADLKSLADYAYCYGINEFVVCASAYQPWLDKIPGNTGGGRHYCLNRNNTYWRYSKDFWDYQARCAYLMRQGIPVIDLCIYLGENAPVKILTHRLPELPFGYDFDAFTTDALMGRMKAMGNQVVLPNGMTYRMMVLPRNGELTLPALRQIASFVEQGLVVYGPRPVHSPGMCDLGQEPEYKSLVARMWGKYPTAEGRNRYGKGTVYWGMTLPEAVAETGMMPDMGVNGENPEKDKIYFAHRRLTDADVYFINNHNDLPLSATFTFRSKRKGAELWNPVTAQRYRLPVLENKTDAVAVKLQMAARESFFVILSDSVGVALPEIPCTVSERAEVIEGSWSVEFAEEMGGPGQVNFTELTDWTSHADPQIKYYSGTAVYRKSLQIAPCSPGESVLLRFDTLSAVAQVILNGDTLATVWCSPWEADLTGAVREAGNEIEIHVTNSLMNRMIGDAMLPPEQRITYAKPQIVSSSDSLIASGMIGQVALVYRR